MKNADKTFIDFCLAARENSELWVKLSKISTKDQLNGFFKELGFKVDPDHVENILVVKSSFSENPGIAPTTTVH